MESVYYTLTARGVEMEGGLERAVGAPRRVMLVRAPKAAPERRENNVVDLAAWRAAREAEAEAAAAAEEYGADEEPWAEEPVREAAPSPLKARRARREHIAVIAGELLSTLAVLAVTAALLVRILVF